MIVATWATFFAASWALGKVQDYILTHHSTNAGPGRVIFFLLMLRAWAVLNCLISWVLIRVWVKVRIWDRVTVTVRVIVTVRVRVSKKLGSG